MQPSTCAMPDAKRRAAAEDVNGKGVFKTKKYKNIEEVGTVCLDAH